MFVSVEDKLYLNAPASLVTSNDALATADLQFSWAEDYMTDNESVLWVLAKYVEADRPNGNGQMWTFADLVEAQDTIRYSPMNVLHRGEAVGVWVNQRMIYPLDDSSNFIDHPFIEVLGALWGMRNPEVAALVGSAYNEGSLFVSMECIPESVTFKADDREETYTWLGPRHESYGEIARIPGVISQLNKPNFVGGALILPPVKPGWSGARVLELASEVIGEDEVNDIVEDIRSSLPEITEEKRILDLASDFLTKRFTAIASAVETDRQETFNSTSGQPNIELKESTDDPQGGVDVMDELEKANAEIAKLKAELQQLKAEASAQVVDSKIAELTESHAAALEEKDAEVAAAKAETDAAILKAEQAESKYTELVEFLDAETAKAQAEAAFAARKEERVAKVKEVASFSDEHIDRRSAEWAALEDEAFEALIADLSAIASKSDGPADEKLPAATAMKHTGDDGDGDGSSYADLFDMIRDGEDFKSIR